MTSTCTLPFTDFFCRLPWALPRASFVALALRAAAAFVAAVGSVVFGAVMPRSPSTTVLPAPNWPMANCLNALNTRLAWVSAAFIAVTASSHCLWAASAAWIAWIAVRKTAASVTGV